eukprot:14119337-Heterocapsa_arctica.AAC.1
MQPESEEEGVVVGEEDALQAAPFDTGSQIVNIFEGCRRGSIAVHCNADSRGLGHVHLPDKADSQPAVPGEPFKRLVQSGLALGGSDVGPSHLDDAEVVEPVIYLGTMQAIEVVADDSRGAEPSAFDDVVFEARVLRETPGQFHQPSD